ncbi:MAG TPA: histidine kinase [Longimicrobiales bacterium]|nr:histidine kinase [Longimicrobiales bacterium]
MILRKWKLWLVLLGAATLLGLLEAAQGYAGAAAMGRTRSWPEMLRSTMPSWYVLLALLPLIVWLSKRFPLDPARWKRALPLHLIAAATFAVLHVTISGWLSIHVLYRGPVSAWSLREIPRLLSVYFVLELVTYFAIVGAYHAYHYGRRYREREGQAAQLALQTSRLEASLSVAKLDSLRMQLNPHFLFNTLNAISVMAMKGERQGVVRMLMLLGDLLRLSLDNNQQVVAVRDELQMLDRYLEIENVRFGDRLTLERDIDPAVLDAEVPSLLLQPLVENAIRHGISRRPGRGVVRIEAAVVDDTFLELSVLDTGPGVRHSRSSDGTGVGLANTRARLEQLYGERHELTLVNRPEGGACATVRLPLRRYRGEPLSESLQTAAV